GAGEPSPDRNPSKARGNARNARNAGSAGSARSARSAGSAFLLPPPLWGRVGVGGARPPGREEAPRGRVPPTPTLPHKGGGREIRPLLNWPTCATPLSPDRLQTAEAGRRERGERRERQER